MNIFYLDEDPETCARYHCDKHVVKMILETTQLLSTAHWVTGGQGPYIRTHENHPSAKWARDNLGNYKWLCKLGIYLCKEYTYRYGKVHKSQEHLIWLGYNQPDLPKDDFYPPTIAMAEEYRRPDLDTINNYRYYYQKAKAHFLNYKGRERPSWLDDEI